MPLRCWPSSFTTPAAVKTLPAQIRRQIEPVEPVHAKTTPSAGKQDVNQSVIGLRSPCDQCIPRTSTMLRAAHGTPMRCALRFIPICRAPRSFSMHCSPPHPYPLRTFILYTIHLVWVAVTLRTMFLHNLPSTARIQSLRRSPDSFTGALPSAGLRPLYRGFDSFSGASIPLSGLFLWRRIDPTTGEPTSLRRRRPPDGAPIGVFPVFYPTQPSRRDSIYVY